MRTLELKDIAGYLPYGLKVLIKRDDNNEIGSEENYGLIRVQGTLYKFEYDIKWETFTATDIYGKHAIPARQYKLFDYLHELKIDYRGLIDAGLAIDANKLDVNPYK